MTEHVGIVQYALPTVEAITESVKGLRQTVTQVLIKSHLILQLAYLKLKLVSLSRYL